MSASGPFIVRHRLACSCDCCPDTRACCDSAKPSQRACATLKEATDLRLASDGGHSGECGLRQYVTVERVTWADLCETVGWLGRDYIREEEWPEVIDAWNAKHGSEVSDSSNLTRAVEIAARAMNREAAQQLLGLDVGDDWATIKPCEREGWIAVAGKAVSALIESGELAPREIGLHVKERDSAAGEVDFWAGLADELAEALEMAYEGQFEVAEYALERYRKAKEEAR